MLKSNGGSGYVKNVLMENFLVRGSAYGLNINQYWENIDPASGDGVQLSDWVFKVRMPSPALLIPVVDAVRGRTGSERYPMACSARPCSFCARTWPPARI